MNVCLPGELISFDGRTASVKPAMDMQLANGEVLSPPSIVTVPICWPIAHGGRAQITVPMKSGDPVLLHFSQRSIENWLSGSNQAPDDPRQFDLSDCFASPVMRPGFIGDTENVNIQYGSGSIKIASNGDITIKSGQVTVNAEQCTFNSDVLVNGLTTFAGGMVGSGGGGFALTGGSLTHNGVNIGDDHVHDGVEPGGSNTGGPQ